MVTTRTSLRRPQGAKASRGVVWIAAGTNLTVAAVKCVAAVLTGGAGMLAEAIHSFVDTGNELLLAYGMHRSKRPADAQHPMGYGRELYFWSFVVALLIFMLGAVGAVAEGVWRIVRPQPIESPIVVFAVLGISAVVEGVSWYFAFRALGARHVTDILRLAHESKNPPVFMVLFEDSAALIGIAAAAIGTLLAERTETPAFDGLASILIGCVLGATAMFLARESKELLIGERADAEIVDSIRQMAMDRDGVCHANDVIAVHRAPEEIVAAFSLDFADELTVPEVEREIAELEARIRARHPEVAAIFVKPQSRPAFEARRNEGAHAPLT